MFKRQVFLFGVLLLGGLVACQSPTPEVTLASPEPLATVAVTPTPKPAAMPTPKSAGEEVGAKASPTPTIPWQIPGIRADDWVKGGADAGLTIVEYSDFQ